MNFKLRVLLKNNLGVLPRKMLFGGLQYPKLQDMTEETKIINLKEYNAHLTVQKQI